MVLCFKVMNELRVFRDLQVSLPPAEMSSLSLLSPLSSTLHCSGLHFVNLAVAGN